MWAASIWRAIPFVGVLLDAHVGKALVDGELFARLHRSAEGCAECRPLLAARSWPRRRRLSRPPCLAARSRPRVLAAAPPAVPPHAAIENRRTNRERESSRERSREQEKRYFPISTVQSVSPDVVVLV